MKIVPLNFCFRGTRDYVQGAEMYNEIINYLAQEFVLTTISDFRLFIHKLASRNCYLLLEQNDQIHEHPREYIANISFNSGYTSFKGYIVEEVRTIEGRFPYDEDEIVKLSQIEGNTIRLLSDSPYSFIETIVALNKHLHLTNYHADGKWLFTRLDLSEIPSNGIVNDVSIELIKNFNNLLTKSKITYNDTVIGSLYFSLVVNKS